MLVYLQAECSCYIVLFFYRSNPEIDWLLRGQLSGLRWSRRCGHPLALCSRRLEFGNRLTQRGHYLGRDSLKPTHIYYWLALCEAQQQIFASNFRPTQTLWRQHKHGDVTCVFVGTGQCTFARLYSMKGSEEYFSFHGCQSYYSWSIRMFTSCILYE